MKQQIGWQWHQMDHMPIICISLQTDSNANASSLSVFTGRMLFLTLNQQSQRRRKINFRKRDSGVPRWV